MLWISSLNINKIKHFERIVIRWVPIEVVDASVRMYD